MKYDDFLFEKNKNDNENIIKRIIKEHKFKLILTPTVLLGLYLAYKRLTSMVKNKNSVKADFGIQDIVIHNYDIKELDQSLEVLESIRGDILSKYKSSGIKLSDSEIEYIFNECIQKDINMGTKIAFKDADSGPLPSEEILMLKITNFFSKELRQSKMAYAATSSNTITLYHFNTLSSLIYDDKQWNVSKKYIHGILAHEFTHIYQEKDPNFKAGDFYQVYPGMSFDNIRYTSSKGELEAFAKGAAVDILNKGYTKQTFLDAFNKNKNISWQLKNYTSLYNKNSNIVNKLKDAILKQLPD